MSSAGRADRSPEIQRLLEEALNNQTASWGRGERTLVEDYLAPQPALRGDNEAVLDLIYHEFLLRRSSRRASILTTIAHGSPNWPSLSCFSSVWTRPSPWGVRVLASERALGTIYRPMECIGDYQILDLLGRGGMAVVYKARDLKLGRIVALKMIAAGGDASAAQLDRFRSEAQAVARLRHPNIIAIYAIGEHENRPYLTLGLAAGGNLSEKLSEKAMAPRDAAVFARDPGRAVHAAHQAGIVHRDLKPSNILLASDGVPKVGDFGLARLLDADSKHTMSGEPVGTPSYMAPEQAAGQASRAGPEADVYALGGNLVPDPHRPPAVSGRVGARDAETGRFRRRRCAAPASARRAARPGNHLPEMPRKRAAEALSQRAVAGGSSSSDSWGIVRFWPARSARPGDSALGPAQSACGRAFRGRPALPCRRNRRQHRAGDSSHQRRSRDPERARPAQEEAQISTAVKEFLEHDLLAQASSRSTSHRCSRRRIPT